MIPRPRNLRFRLRTLLLAMLVIGAGLGWWFRPFTIVRRWPNGKMQYELHVRRAWNGTLVTNGRQRWWWGNGQLARDGLSIGFEIPRSYERLSVIGERCWHPDGYPVNGVNFANVWTKGFDVPPWEDGTDWSLHRFAETEYDP